jgi:hypothetical protein
MKPRVLLLCCLSLMPLLGGRLLLLADDRFWDKQEVSAWTPEQKTQFLTASPWAKQVTAVLTSNDSNMAGATPRSSGSGRRGGAVYSSRGSSSSTAATTMPKFQGIVRWVSSPLMQQILKPKLPENFKGHYVISVTGLPIGEDTAIMVEQTTMQLKRGDPVHPESAYQDPGDTATIYFAFLPSMLDASSGKIAVFIMEAQPFEIKTKFNIPEMKIHGEPSL